MIRAMNGEKISQPDSVSTFAASQQAKLIYLFSYVGITSCLVFGIYNVVLRQYGVASLELVASIIAALNLATLHSSGNVKRSSSVILAIMLALLCSLLFTGGIGQTGILWFYTFPALAFFLKGSRRGMLWVGYLYILSLAAFLLGAVSDINLAFPYLTLQQLWLSLLAVSLIIYFYQNVNEKNQATIQDRTHELKNAKDETEGILDNMLEGAQIVDAGWRYVYVNDAAAKQGRRAKGALLGRTMMEVYPGIEGTPMFDRLKQCMETHAPQNMENEFQFPDGDKAWFDLRIEPVPQGVFILSVDITEKKKIALQQAELVAIVDSSDDAIIGKTLQGIITSWNSGAEKMYGYTPKEVIGKSISMIVPKDHPSEIPAILKRIASGESIEHYRTIRQTKDGRILDVSLTVSPIKNSKGEIVGASAIARDITETIKNEDKMMKLQKDLEVEKVKEEFVSLASHQLRTPLTAIQGYTDMLLEGDAGEINEKQKHYLGQVYHANKRMLDLINALLNASRIDLGVFAIEPAPIDITQIAETQLQDLAMKIKEKKQNIEKEIDANIGLLNLDPKLTAILFQNLLSNAVKYTSEGGIIKLIVKKAASDIRITVRDTGMGIPKAQQPQIFSKLFRADNARVADPDGTGLGLYVVKAIVEESGGKIWFETEENKGTSFYITVPLTGMKKREGIKGLT